MSSHRPLENHSPQVNRFKATYGGSTRQAPFFRTPETVRYNSLSKARQLGALRELRTTLDGRLGGINGTNSHFLQITLTETARLGARLVDASHCAIDWICIHFMDASRRSLVYGASGFVNSPDDSSTIQATSSSTTQLVGIDAYVSVDYWQSGYTSAILTISDGGGGTTELDYDTYLETLARNTSITPGSLEEFALQGQLADPLPAGTYTILLTTTRWQDTPYQLQVVALPLSRDIEGTAVFTLEPAADTGVRQLDGDIALSFSPYARLKETIDLDGNTASQLAPRADMAVTSPLS